MSAPAHLRRIASLLGGALDRWWVLAGGVSAETYGVVVVGASGSSERLLVRRTLEAEKEYRVLCTLARTPVPVPAPRLLDGEHLVTAFVDDAAGTVDDVETLSVLLGRVHGADAGRFGFLPDHEEILVGRLRRNSQLGEIVRGAKQRLGRVSRNPATLLHGDFWPGNVLCRDGTVAALIDWEDAALGDPLADLANARLELLWAGGVGAMNRLTSTYLERFPCDTRALAFWDLAAALKLEDYATWAEPARLPLMGRRFDWFVEQARRELFGDAAPVAE